MTYQHEYYVAIGSDGVPINWAEAQYLMPSDFPELGLEDFRCDGCDFPTRVCGPLTLVDVIRPDLLKVRHKVCEACTIWWSSGMIILPVGIPSE